MPILTGIYNHWFAREAVPGCIIKSVITLLKKGGRYFGGDLDVYKPKTLLNTE